MVWYYYTFHFHLLHTDQQHCCYDMESLTHKMPHKMPHKKVVLNFLGWYQFLVKWSVLFSHDLSSITADMNKCRCLSIARWYGCNEDNEVYNPAILRIHTHIYYIYIINTYFPATDNTHRAFSCVPCRPMYPRCCWKWVVCPRER